MAGRWIPNRIDVPELMDGDGLPTPEVEEAYRVLCRVNRQLGNLRTVRDEIRRFLAEDVANQAEVSVLDVGSGSGDIPEAIAGSLAGRPARVYALDRDPTAVAAASRRALIVVRGDALRLPFEDRSIDLVLAVKFAHHFHGPALDQLLAEMARVARHRVLVLDIRRHWLAYWGFRAWSTVFTRNRLVRNDGPISVLRGFLPEELLDTAGPIPGYTWTVRRSLGFQVALVGRRIRAT